MEECPYLAAATAPDPESDAALEAILERPEQPFVATVACNGYKNIKLTWPARPGSLEEVKQSATEKFEALRQENPPMGLPDVPFEIEEIKIRRWKTHSFQMTHWSDIQVLSSIEQLDDFFVRPFRLVWPASSLNEYDIEASPQSSAVRRAADILEEIEKARERVRAGKDYYAKDPTAADGKVSAMFKPVHLFVSPKLPGSVSSADGEEALEQADLKRNFGLRPVLKASELPRELVNGTVLATDCGGGSGSGGGMYWVYNYYVQHEGKVYCVSLRGDDYNGQSAPSVAGSTMAAAKAHRLTLAGKRVATSTTAGGQQPE